MAGFFDPSEEWLKKVCEDMGISLNRVQEDVQVIKDWMEMQPHLPNPHVDDGMLYVNMLLRCKGSMEVTKQAIDFYYSQRAPVPEFFRDRDPCGKAISKVPSYLKTTVLKDLTSQGCRVTIFQPGPNSEPFSAEDMCKWWILNEDIRLKEEASVNHIYVHDATHVTMGHVVKVSLPTMHKSAVCYLNGFKGRVKGVHILNLSPVAEIILNAAKKMVPAKIRARVHVHPTVESLHAHIDKEILPKDYGGDKPSLADLTDEWVKEVRGQRAWVLAKDARSHVYESKRPGKTFNASDVFGIEGTFKQLAVD